MSLWEDVILLSSDTDRRPLLMVNQTGVYTAPDIEKMENETLRKFQILKVIQPVVPANVRRLNSPSARTRRDDSHVSSRINTPPPTNVYRLFACAVSNYRRVRRVSEKRTSRTIYAPVRTRFVDKFRVGERWARTCLNVNDRSQ